jgi:hypothetical protein
MQSSRNHKNDRQNDRCPQHTVLPMPFVIAGIGRVFLVASTSRLNILAHDGLPSCPTTAITTECRCETLVPSN